MGRWAERQAIRLDETRAAMDLAARARDAVADVPKDLLSRTAAFLLLKASRSSIAIEGERPPHDRIRRWGRAIGEVGWHPVTLDVLAAVAKPAHEIDDVAAVLLLAEVQKSLVFHPAQSSLNKAGCCPLNSSLITRSVSGAGAVRNFDTAT